MPNSMKLHEIAHRILSFSILAFWYMIEGSENEGSVCLTTNYRGHMGRVLLLDLCTQRAEDNIASLHRIREFAEGFGADDLNLSHMIPNRAWNVSPCMGLLHTADTYLGDHKRRIRHHSFGNVYEQSLGEIWESGEYRTFRQRVHEFRYAPCLFCSGCELLEENKSDCIGSLAPTCGGCLWGQGFAVCP